MSYPGGRINPTDEKGEEVMEMSRSEKQLAALVAAVAGIVVLHKFADKEAKALGIPVVAVSAAVWALS